MSFSDGPLNLLVRWLDNSRVICNCQGKVHDYGNLKKLRQHEQTAAHKRFTDSVFAESERETKKYARPTISCSVKGCDYTSSDACNLRRHEVVCKVKAENILTSGNFSGFGTHKFTNDKGGCTNGRYVGNFRNGQMHGEGTYTFDKLGDAITAVFTYGILNGPGTHTFDDGEM